MHQDTKRTMLLIALTTEPLKTALPVPTVFRERCGTFDIVVATSLGGTVADDGDAWSFKAQPAGIAAVTTDPALMTVSLSRSERRLTLSKSSECGLPLYFQVSPDGAFYAATHISLLRCAGVALQADDRVLPEFLLYRCVMPPRTLFRNISRLFHGGTLDISAAGSACIIRRHAPPAWLQGAGSVVQSRSFSDQVAALADLLRKSIRRLQDAPARVALLMSGGIDSSMTAILGRSELGIDRTISTAYPFELPELDMEKRYALSAAAALGFRHRHYVGTTSEYRRALIMATAHAEEPVHHLQSPCLDMLLENGLEDGVDTVVQGLGAGGVFGNFRNHLYLSDKRLFQFLCRRLGRDLLGVLSRWTGRGTYLCAKLDAMVRREPLESPAHPLWDWHLHGDSEWVGHRFGTRFDAIIAPVCATLRSMQAPTEYDLWARYSLLGDEDATLAINAKIADGRGCRLHSPLYDPEVLRAALAISWPEKMHAPENRLRKAMAARIGVPAWIRNRRKTGFGIKRKDWALAGGVFDPLIATAGRVFDPDTLRAVQRTEYSQAMTFWCMLSYALWKRLIVDNEPVGRLLAELAEAENRGGRHA